MKILLPFILLTTLSLHGAQTSENNEKESATQTREVPVVQLQQVPKPKLREVTFENGTDYTLMITLRARFKTPSARQNKFETCFMIPSSWRIDSRKKTITLQSKQLHSTSEEDEKMRAEILKNVGPKTFKMIMRKKPGTDSATFDLSQANRFIATMLDGNNKPFGTPKCGQLRDYTVIEHMPKNNHSLFLRAPTTSERQ